LYHGDVSKIVGFKHLMLKIFAPIIFASNYFQVNENAPILAIGITISLDSK
jgi:hypothetical protein